MITLQSKKIRASLPEKPGRKRELANISLLIGLIITCLFSSAIADPDISVEPSTIYLPPSDNSCSFVISNSGDATAWTLTENTNWITGVDPDSGNLAQNDSITITVTINRTGIDAREYQGIITLTYGSNTKEIKIKLSVAGAVQQWPFNPRNQAHCFDHCMGGYQGNSGFHVAIDLPKAGNTDVFSVIQGVLRKKTGSGINGVVWVSPTAGASIAWSHGHLDHIPAGFKDVENDGQANATNIALNTVIGKVFVWKGRGGVTDHLHLEKIAPKQWYDAINNPLHELSPSPGMAAKISPVLFKKDNDDYRNRKTTHDFDRLIDRARVIHDDVDLVSHATTEVTQCATRKNYAETNANSYKATGLKDAAGHNISERYLMDWTVVGPRDRAKAELTYDLKHRTDAKYYYFNYFLLTNCGKKLDTEIRTANNAIINVMKNAWQTKVHKDAVDDNEMVGPTGTDDDEATKNGDAKYPDGLYTVTTKAKVFPTPGGGFLREDERESETEQFDTAYVNNFSQTIIPEFPYYVGGEVVKASGGNYIPGKNYIIYLTEPQEWPDHKDIAPPPEVVTTTSVTANDDGDIPMTEIWESYQPNGIGYDIVVDYDKDSLYHLPREGETIDALNHIYEPAPVGNICSDDILPIPLPCVTFGNSCVYTDDYAYDGPDVVYQTTLDTCQLLTISLCNTGPYFDTHLLVYPEDDCGGTPIAEDDDGCSEPESGVSLIEDLRLEAGTYYVIVDAHNGECGNYFLEIDAEPCPPRPDNDACADAIDITAYPDSVCGTTIGADSDCPGVLDNNAVWYTFDLPFDHNEVIIDYCSGETDIDSADTFSEVLYSGCPADSSECGSYINAYMVEFVDCDDSTVSPRLTWLNLPGPATYFLPVYFDSGIDFCFDMNVNEHFPVVIDCEEYSITYDEYELCGDSINNGCNIGSGIENFEMIGYEDTICGSSWSDSLSCDSDWYLVSIAEPGYISMSTIAEFPVYISFMESGDCDPPTYTILDYTTSTAGESAQISAWIEPGAFWFQVKPSELCNMPCDGSGVYGNNYVTTISIERGMPEISIDPTSIYATAECSYTEILTIDNIGSLTSRLTFRVFASTDPYGQICTKAAKPHDKFGDDFSISFSSAKDYDKLGFFGKPNVPRLILQGGDRIDDAQDIGDPALPYIDSGATNGYTDDYDVPCPYESGSPEVVYKWTPSMYTHVDIDLGGSGYDTKLYVYDADTNVVDCDDDYNPDWTSAIVQMPVAAGEVYYIVIDGFDGDYGDYAMEIRENTTCEISYPQWTDSESEDCGENVNNGCSSMPPSMEFETIECWAEIAGTIWSDSTDRDTDWYLLELEEPSIIAWSIIAEFPSAIAVFDGNQNCHGDTIDYAMADPCSTASITVNLAAGNWYLWAGPSGWYDIQCEGGGDYPNNYIASLSCGEPWLSVDLYGGTVGEGEPQVDVTVSINAADLDTGTYTGNIEFYSNDMLYPVVSIPVTLEHPNECIPGYEYIPGDCNMSNGLWPVTVVGGDVTYLVNYFIQMNDGCKIDGFFMSADVNGDCLVIGSDVTRMVNYFRMTGDIEYCADYEPLWPTPEDCPVDPPDGWPNCDPPPPASTTVPVDLTK
ncbi:MAG: BACON domain-containing protein [candidate division Zixibacteria bacterium]|nr:BACON domain-containing protein [candidate division Zixibacteria bacterium]